MVPLTSISLSNNDNPSGQEFQFFTGNGWSPNTDWKIASALESQTAFISGNPEEGDDLELFYYRFVSDAQYPLPQRQTSSSLL